MVACLTLSPGKGSRGSYWCDHLRPNAGDAEYIQSRTVMMKDPNRKNHKKHLEGAIPGTHSMTPYGTRSRAHAAPVLMPRVTSASAGETETRCRSSEDVRLEGGRKQTRKTFLIGGV